jgi:DNA-binding MarR family transcriptional regulator
MIPADEPCTPEGETPRGSSSRPSANGLLLAAGNLLTGDQGLTSARWQVLGAIALAQRPLTVPQIARRVGLTRRAICGTVGRLVRDGLLALAPNADHRRSPLVCLSEPGRATHAAIDRRQAAWVKRLAVRIGRADLETTRASWRSCAAGSRPTTPKTSPGPAEQEETMRTPPEPPKCIQPSSGRPRRRR